MPNVVEGQVAARATVWLAHNSQGHFFVWIHISDPRLKPIVAADSGLYFAEYTFGAALAQKGQYAEAAKHLHKAIELQPDSAWAHCAMGASLLKTADFKTAAVHMEIAAGRLPGFAAGHLALAEAYEHVGRAADAKRERGKAPETVR